MRITFILDIQKNHLPLITFVFGTRPEAVKLAPVIIKFKKSKKFKVRVISTGQHKDLVEDVLNFFGICLDKDLEIMKSTQSLSYLTESIINKLEKEFLETKPEIVLVQGDTTSAFAAALCSFYLKIPVAHIEAGLRTGNLLEPFPEEANRRLITQIANLHFAPTQNALDNLNKIGITKNAYKTGNTVIDALNIASTKILDFDFNELNFKNKKIILTTIHRRENWGNKLLGIAKGIKKVLDNYPDSQVILPMHPNKKVREPLKRILGNNPQALLIEPLDYGKLVYLIKNCYFVITDSGGLQEEAPSLGKPVLVIRDVTERCEAIEAGSSKLVGTKEKNIYKEASLLLSNEQKYHVMAKAKNTFGDGTSSDRIFAYICNRLKVKN